MGLSGASDWVLVYELCQKTITKMQETTHPVVHLLKYDRRSIFIFKSESETSDDLPFCPCHVVLSLSE